MKFMQEAIERFESWKRMKRKECAVRKETDRRGGKEARDRRRAERRLDIENEKRAIFKDLQNGWMLGDFRPFSEDIDVIRKGWARVTHEELKKIHSRYRSF